MDKEIYFTGLEVQNMNTSGMLRGYLSKVMDQESFFFHVISCMEKQLND